MEDGSSLDSETMESQSPKKGGVDDNAFDHEDDFFEPVSFCSRLKSDFSSPFFGLKEADGKAIDIEQSFSPSPGPRTLFFRLIFFGLSVAALAVSIKHMPKENRFIYMAYLTHWVLVLAIVYQIAAIYCTIKRESLSQPLPPSEEQRPKLPVRFMWGAYSQVAPAYIIVVVLYWLQDYDPDQDEITFGNLMNHGGVALCIFLDGVALGVIPIRMKQILFLYVLAIAFLVWSVIHDFSGIGDGNWEFEDPNDPAEDSLYKILSWSTDPKRAAITCVLVLFVYCPVVYLITWTLSVWSRWCRLDGSRRRIYRKANENSVSSMGTFDDEVVGVQVHETKPSLDSP